MNRRTNLATVLLTTTLATLSAGCDPEGLEASDSELDFRFFTDMKGTGPGKLNTNFLGKETLPLDNIPLSAGGEVQVELLEIRATQCIDSNGSLLQGRFSTQGLDLEPRVTPDGRLRAMMVRDSSDPSRTCMVQGTLWADTFWEVRLHKTVLGTIETDLWLTDVGQDARGFTMYAWSVNYGRIDPQYGRRYRRPYRSTCDEDEDTPGLRYHAYLVPDLRLSDLGKFSTAPGGRTMFIACGSGAVGKALSWGYHPMKFGTETHELATRMVRADYCGDGVAHTEAGTSLWVFDNALYPETAPAELAYEAVWSPSARRAICVSRPRSTEAGQDPEPVVCGEHVLPECDEGVHFDELGQQGKLGAIVTSVEDL